MMVLHHPLTWSQRLAMLWQAWCRRMTLGANSEAVIVALVAHSGVHTRADNMENIDLRTLQAVGQTMVHVIWNYNHRYFSVP